MEPEVFDNPFDGIRFVPEGLKKYAVIDGKRILGTFSTLEDALAGKAIWDAKRGGRKQL
jgi:hypothetical protein